MSVDFLIFCKKPKLWYNLNMERTDDLQLKGLKIIQDTELFSYGTDAVLLSSFVKTKKGDSIVDLGTGTGILPLLIYGKNTNVTLNAIEIQKPLYEIAKKSVALNNLQASINIIHGDIKDAPKFFKEANIVVCNPPYEKQGDGFSRLSDSHKIARVEMLITFDDICISASKLLKTGGNFFLIHRPSRLSELFSTLTKNKLEPKIIRFVHTYVTSEPKLVLISASKEGKTALRVMPPLIMYDDNKNYTQEVKEIYGDGYER